MLPEGFESKASKGSPLPLFGGFFFWGGDLMSAESFKRKLTAILSADVKGYSRLMGENEAETVKTLTASRRIMGELIQQHRGRVIDSPGDNILAEFGSVVDAVHCAVAAQNEFKARNADLPENRRMEFRIGVNLGDVIEEEGRIYGDGVNIAARLEALADPGGICISKTAFDQIETKLPLGYEFLGEQEVKNIAKPVGAYRVLMEPRITVAGAKEVKPSVPVWSRKGVLAGAVAVLLLIIGLGIWHFNFRTPKIEPASVERMAFPLPEKPSIAVLPFVNMSGDPGQDFLVDGITENIITALSGVSKLFVIARNSTFTYKGKPVKVQQVAEDLGVRYVLEGSVVRSGDRIRVTAQLIDALKGHHLWAERYDQEMKNIFVLQDDLAMKILRGVGLKLTRGEDALAGGNPPKSLDVFLKMLQAREHLRVFNIDDNNRARIISEECMALEPDFWGSYSLVGSVHMMDYFLGSTRDPVKSLLTAIQYLEKAVALSDEAKGRVYPTLGYLYSMKKDYDKAIELGEKAIAIVPNGAEAHAWLAMSLNYAGRAQEAIPLFEKAIRLNPFPPAFYYMNLGNSYRLLGGFEEAVAMYKKTVALSPNNIIAFVNLAGTCGLMGKEEEAKAAAAEILRLNPKWSIEYYAKTSLFKDRDRVVEGLRKAGLPEKPPLPLPDKPSIAVLPFVNMSDDKSQEFFSDGLTEEIITALSKTPKLFVIARNSTFVYKGKPVNVQQVSRELGVKYVLEGSVRRSGDQLRITVQLIDATTGNHLWAERYDREMKDVFAIQDEITMKILSSFLQLTEEQMWHMRGRHPSNLQAYLKLLEGIAYWNESKYSDAMRYFEEALGLDPHFPDTYAWIAWAHMMNVWFGPSATRAQSLEKAIQFAEKVKVLAPDSAGGPATLGHAYLLKRDYDRALSEGKLATELGPNHPLAATYLGWTLRSIRRYEEAMNEYERAIRLDPLNSYTLFQIGMNYFMMRRYDDSISVSKKALEQLPKALPVHLTLAMAYSSLNMMEEARVAASDVLKISPNFSLEHFAKAQPCKYEEDRDHIINALRKAGLK
jgi:adenylate cyclase